MGLQVAGVKPTPQYDEEHHVMEILKLVNAMIAIDMIAKTWNNWLEPLL